MKKTFGTDVVSGLNAAESSRTMQDHELLVSENGWTDKAGVWQPSRDPRRIASGYTDIKAFASGRIDGVTHNVWVDGDAVYDDQSLGVNYVVTPPLWDGTFGDDVFILAVADGFLILGGDRNYLYNGDNVTEWGIWQAYYMGGYSLNSSTAVAATTITAISQASQAVILTSNTGGMATGDWLWIDGVVGMTEINDGGYEVVSVSGGVSITIDHDTSDYTAYSSGGTIYFNSSCTGISTGEYKYYVVPTIRMNNFNSEVYEGRPRGLIDTGSTTGTDFSLGPDDSWEADSMTLDSYTEVRMVIGVHYEDPSGDQIWSNTGTPGGTATDYSPGFRLYRTKADGVDIYLEREWWYEDSEWNVDSDKYTIDMHWTHKHDMELGAVYTASLSGHENPPLASFAAIAGSRIFYNDNDNLDHLRWTELDGPRYSDPNSYILIPHNITALGNQRERCVIFSVDQMWWFTLQSGLPYLKSIDTEVGCEWPTALDNADAGLTFLREDGMWLYDGVGVRKVSRQGFDSIANPSSLCADGDTMYLSGDVDAYLTNTTNKGRIWHSYDHQIRYADACNGSFFGASSNAVYEMFDGPQGQALIVSKEFGDWNESRAIRLLLDVSGTTTPTIYINGNKMSDLESHHGGEVTLQPNIRHWPGGPRRIVEYSVPQLANVFYTIGVEVSGDTKIHGYKLEVEA